MFMEQWNFHAADLHAAHMKSNMTSLPPKLHEITRAPHCLIPPLSVDSLRLALFLLRGGTRDVCPLKLR